MLQRLANLLAFYTLGRWIRYAYYSFRRRYMCPHGRHGDHWQYFGPRTRICRVCHKEEWFYPHGGWQSPPDKWAQSTRAPDEPTDGN